MRPPLERASSLTALVGLALSISLLGSPTGAHAEQPAKPAESTTVSHANVLSPAVKNLIRGTGIESEAKALETYWTPARMKAAKPVDGTLTVNRVGAAPKRTQATQADGPAVSIAPLKVASKAIGTVKSGAKKPQTTYPGYPSSSPAARTNGKIFFSRDGSNYVCSGSVVNSEGRSLVWTAGHCLGENGTWSYNVAFVPAYSNGSRPYGSWYAKDLATKTAWLYDSDHANDVGAITLAPNAGVRIADQLGAQGLMWNQSANYWASAFGYPAVSPYTGQVLVRADGNTADEGDGTIYMYSGLTGGSSGGPWLRNFDENWGYVNGHNDFIYTASPSWMYSPYYGAQVASLYEFVRYNEVYALATATPTISGTAKVGNTLTAKPGNWKPSSVNLAFQWKANGKAIAGAITPKLTLPASTKGATITVTVTGSKLGYTTASKTSKATKKVAAGTLSGATPTISGSTKVGQLLTANPGAWKPSPVTLTYAWYRNGKAIKGATSSAYTLTKSDKGKKITVKVTGKKAAYTTLTKTSKKTAKVK